MDLSDLEKSISGMSDDELRNRIIKIRRDRRNSGNRAVKKKKTATKRREPTRMSPKNVLAGLTDEEKLDLVNQLQKSLEEDK